jgi:8-oxo-dGTP diphosphatase
MPLTGPAARPTLDVAAGVLHDAAGRVLIAQRPEGKHAAGFWEFPGGKLAAGESPVAGLVRELAEELGVVVQAAEPLLEVSHDYPDRRVVLHVFRVTSWSGEPAGLEGQPLRWVAVDELGAARILPADQPVIAALAGG